MNPSNVSTVDASRDTAGVMNVSGMGVQLVRPSAEGYVGKETYDGIVGVIGTSGMAAQTSAATGDTMHGFKKRWTREELMAFDPDSLPNGPGASSSSVRNPEAPPVHDDSAMQEDQQEGEEANDQEDEKPGTVK